MMICEVANQKYSGDLHNCGNTTEDNCTTPTIYQKKYILYSGAHSRVATLIQPSFPKKRKKIVTVSTRERGR